MGKGMKIDPEVEKLLANRKWRLENLYKIKNAKSKVITFKPNMVQRRMLENFWYKNVVLKARQFGITTFMCILQLDAILFETDIETMIIAHREDDAKDFFQKKVLFAYDMLPEWLKVMRPTSVRRGGELRINHGNNRYSSMRVSTSGRGGTLKYLHVSEFGKICAKHPEAAGEIISGALNAGSGQITTFESTAEGAFGPFYEICTKAEELQRNELELTRMDYYFHFFPWYEHSDYYLDADFPITSEWELYFKPFSVTDAQKRWYIKKHEEQGQEFMLREFPSTSAEAFAKVLKGTYYGRELERRGLQKEVKHNPNLHVHTAMDLGYKDALVIIYFQFSDNHINVLASSEINRGDWPDIVIDMKGRGYNYGVHFVPHDVKQNKFGVGTTPLERAWNDFGLRLHPLERTAVSDGINIVRARFCDITIDPYENGKLLSALRAYRKEFDEKRGIWKDKPYHDWSSDYADAFRYMCVGCLELENGNLLELNENIRDGGVL